MADLDLTTDPAEAVARTDQLLPVYRAAFGPPPWNEPEASALAWAARFPRHAEREAFRLVTAAVDGVVVGFAYAYTGEREHPWPTWVLEHAPHVADQVGGHVELVELAVDPAHQRAGLGSALHDAVLADLPHERALTMTLSGTGAAPSFYRRHGWHVLVERIDGRHDVMVRELPL